MRSYLPFLLLVFPPKAKESSKFKQTTSSVFLYSRILEMIQVVVVRLNITYLNPSSSRLSVAILLSFTIKQSKPKKSSAPKISQDDVRPDFDVAPEESNRKEEAGLESHPPEKTLNTYLKIKIWKHDIDDKYLNLFANHSCRHF